MGKMIKLTKKQREQLEELDLQMAASKIGLETAMQCAGRAQQVFWDSLRSMVDAGPLDRLKIHRAHKKGLCVEVFAISDIVSDQDMWMVLEKAKDLLAENKWFEDAAKLRDLMTQLGIKA